MSTAKVAITIEQDLLNKLNRLVKSHVFPNRSKTIQEAVADKLDRLEHNRLAQECAKLDIIFEQAIANEGLSLESESWPED